MDRLDYAEGPVMSGLLPLSTIGECMYVAYTSTQLVKVDNVKAITACMRKMSIITMMNCG